MCNNAKAGLKNSSNSLHVFIIKETQAIMIHYLVEVEEPQGPQGEEEEGEEHHQDQEEVVGEEHHQVRVEEVGEAVGHHRDQGEEEEEEGHPPQLVLLELLQVGFSTTMEQTKLP